MERLESARADPGMTKQKRHPPDSAEEVQTQEIAGILSGRFGGVCSGGRVSLRAEFPVVA